MISPKVSILMSAYNAQEYIREAIDSILNQTFHDFEFLIINDGSTDNSLNIIESYKDPRIRLIHNKINLGLTKSLNIGLKEARGEYIARMDADDISLPNRFRWQMEYMEAHPDIVLISGNIEIIDAHGNSLWKSDKVNDPDLIAWELLFHNYIGGHSQVLFRRDIALQFGGYSEDCRYSQDYDLWSRFSQKYNLAILPQVLIKWRSHEQNISTKLTSEQETILIRQVKQQLSRLINKDVDLKLAEHLHFFWTNKFDRCGAPFVIQGALLKIVRSFARHRLINFLSKEIPETKIRRAMAQCFLRWSKSINKYHNLVLKLLTLRLAMYWDPKMK